MKPNSTKFAIQTNEGCEIHKASSPDLFCLIHLPGNMEEADLCKPCAKVVLDVTLMIPGETDLPNYFESKNK